MYKIDKYAKIVKYLSSEKDFLLHKGRFINIKMLIITLTIHPLSLMLSYINMSNEYIID